MHNRVGGEVQSLVISSQIAVMGKGGKMSNLVEDSPIIINFQFQLVLELTLHTIRSSENIHSYTSSTTIYRKILQTKLFSVLSGTMQSCKQCIETCVNNNNQ